MIQIKCFVTCVRQSQLLGPFGQSSEKHRRSCDWCVRILIGRTLRLLKVKFIHSLLFLKLTKRCNRPINHVYCM